MSQVSHAFEADTHTVSTGAHPPKANEANLSLFRVLSLSPLPPTTTPFPYPAQHENLGRRQFPAVPRAVSSANGFVPFEYK